MRRTDQWLSAGVLAGLLVGCSAIVGIGDVPNPEDGGQSDGSQSDGSVDGPGGDSAQDSSADAGGDGKMPGSPDSTADGPAPCGIVCDEGGTLTAGEVLYGADSVGIARVVADQQGYFYVAGVYDEVNAMSAGLQLGDATLPSPQQGNAFLAKVDASGNVLWAQAFAGAGTSSIRDLVVDASGNIVVLGVFATDGTAQGAMHIGTSSLTLTSQNIGTGWLFLASFDPNGNAHWADRLWDDVNPVTDDFFAGEARLAAGPNNLQVLAVTQGTLRLTWGSDQSGAAEFASIVSGATTSDIFLIQLNLDGTFAPAFTGSEPLEPGFYDIGCDDSSEATVSALATTLNGTLPVTYIAGSCATPSVPSGAPDPRGAGVASGNFLLQLQENSPAVYGSNATLVANVTSLLGSKTGDGSVYDALAGTPFTLEWRDPQTLAPKWMSGATTAGQSKAMAITNDEKGNLVGLGTCSGSLSFNTSNPNGDITGRGLCIAAYDSMLGRFAWVDTLGVALTTMFRQLDNLGIAGTPAGGVGFGGTGLKLASLDGGTLDGGSTSLFFGVLAP